MTDLNKKRNAVQNALRRLSSALEDCCICPRRCHANRKIGKRGYCRAPYRPTIYSYGPHHGEEPPVSGTSGSGTIFFSHCNMKCCYCQNYRFSQLDDGEEVEIDRLAAMMIELQRSQCHNINLVSPTHFVPQILAALDLALESGLSIPIVYNSSGYDSLEMIKLLDGIVDIYLPDMRYSDNAAALKYSDAADYVERNRECILQMQKQTPGIVTADDGTAIRGFIIRLLVLPGGASGTLATLRFIRDNLGKDVFLSIMSQYYPTYKAYSYKEISGPVVRLDYKNIVDEAHLLGLNNGWVQEEPAGFDPKFFGTNIPPKRKS